MGLADTFGKEDRAEITINQLQMILTAMAEREVILRGIVNRVPHEYIETMIFGDKKPAEKESDKCKLNATK